MIFGRQHFPAMFKKWITGNTFIRVLRTPLGWKHYLFIFMLCIILFVLYLYFKGPDPFDALNIIDSITDEGELRIQSQREGMIHCRLRGVAWPNDGKIRTKIIDDILQVANDGIQYSIRNNGEADLYYYRVKYLSINEMVLKKLKEYAAQSGDNDNGDGGEGRSNSERQEKKEPND